MKFHNYLKIKVAYFNFYESEKKLNKIDFENVKLLQTFWWKKHPVKELSFVILPSPKHSGTYLSTHFQKYQNCYKEKSECW